MVIDSVILVVAEDSTEVAVIRLILRSGQDRDVDPSSVGLIRSRPIGEMRSGFLGFKGEGGVTTKDEQIRSEWEDLIHAQF